MSVISEILSLRSNRASTVSTLRALLDWKKAAQNGAYVLSRGYAVAEAVDIVAARAAETLIPTSHDSHNTALRPDVAAQTTPLRYTTMSSA